MEYANKKWPVGRPPEPDPMTKAEADFLEASALFGPDSAEAVAAGIALRLMQRLDDPGFGA